jgi:hypothetical protein
MTFTAAKAASHTAASAATEGMIPKLIRRMP